MTYPSSTGHMSSCDSNSQVRIHQTLTLEHCEMQNFSHELAFPGKQIWG